MSEPRFVHIRIRALQDYDDRITKGKIYKAHYEKSRSYLATSINFVCNLGMQTQVSYASCVKGGSWFTIIPYELNKNIKVI